MQFFVSHCIAIDIAHVFGNPIRAKLEDTNNFYNLLYIINGHMLVS